MVTITSDPQNPDRLALTATVTIYIDRLLTDVLSTEVASAIRQRAVKDLTRSRKVRQAISEAAGKKLLGMLGCGEAVNDTQGTGE